ncbi:hypothetical protein ACO0SA_001663 [Hanseniaspora valbyensis]
MFSLTRTNSSFEVKYNDNKKTPTRKPFSQLNNSNLNTISNNKVINKELIKNDIIGKYSRATNQHSKRSMNSLHIMNLPKESSLLNNNIGDFKIDEELQKASNVYNDYNDDLEGETLEDEPLSLLTKLSSPLKKKSLTIDSTDDSHKNMSIDAKRVLMNNRLPSFSFSYSFDPSVSVNSNSSQIEQNTENNGINKEQMKKFINGLKDAKLKYEHKRRKHETNKKITKIDSFKENIMKPKSQPLCNKHSALSISVAESLLTLTKNKK